MHFGTITLTAR